MPIERSNQNHQGMMEYGFLCQNRHILLDLKTMKSCFHSQWYWLETVFKTTRKVYCDLKINVFTFFSALSNPGGKPTNLSGSSNLSSSFNSGLNTFGLNNSYGNNNGFSSGANSLNNSPQFNSTNNSLNYQQKKEVPSWLGK